MMLHLIEEDWSEGGEIVADLGRFATWAEATRFAHSHPLPPEHTITMDDGEGSVYEYDPAGGGEGSYWINVC